MSLEQSVVEVVLSGIEFLRDFSLLPPFIRFAEDIEKVSEFSVGPSIVGIERNGLPEIYFCLFRDRGD